MIIIMIIIIIMIEIVIMIMVIIMIIIMIFLKCFELHTKAKKKKITKSTITGKKKKRSHSMRT